MNEMKYTLLTEVLGRWKADVIESFLKEAGIDVVVIQATVSDLFTTTFSPVKIFVPNGSIQQARDLLKTFDEPQEEREE